MIHTMIYELCHSIIFIHYLHLTAFGYGLLRHKYA